MGFINKITRKFQNLIGFERLNPINDFDEKFEEIKSINNIELFKKAIDEHEELKEVIWIGVYHCLNTYDVNLEYLSVLNNDFQLIGDLIEGNEDNVKIPKKVKQEILNGNVLATFHNHFKGAIIPSSKDLKNTILPFIKFMVITSENNIGIIVNNMNFDQELLKQEWVLFLAYLNWSFNNDFAIEIEELYQLNLDKRDFKNQEQILFEKYISMNLDKFIKEFNNRMEKYNVYFLYIELMEK